MHKKSLQYSLSVIFIFITTVSHGSGDPELAQSILEKSDQIHVFRGRVFRSMSQSTPPVPAQPEDMHKYRVLSKGNENSLVMTTAPAWSGPDTADERTRPLDFVPDVSQPVRLSLSQRLTGQVANGDLARANFTGDYTAATILRTEALNGENYYVLDLTGVDKSVTYHKVLYWVRQSNFWPYRAEFYSLSNRFSRRLVMRISRRYWVSNAQPALLWKMRSARARNPHWNILK